jgi:beta-phosphoglucomutase-like phosphatase (HAD superfamily)
VAQQPLSAHLFYFLITGYNLYMKKAIIFDMDGVLLETEPQTFKFYQKYLQENFKILLKDEDFKKKIGRKSIDFFNDILSDEDIKKIKIIDLVELKRKEFHNSLGSFVSAIPFGKELLKELKEKGYLLALASQNEKIMIEKSLEWLGIKDYFQIILSLQDIKNKKPDPEIYLLAMERLGVKPEESIIIEDSESGILAAKKSGAYVVALQHPYSPQEHIKKADVVVRHLSEIKNIADKYFFK